MEPLFAKGCSKASAGVWEASVDLLAACWSTGNNHTMTNMEMLVT